MEPTSPKLDRKPAPGIRFDENGHAIPFTEEELRARKEAFSRLHEELAAIPDDPPGSDEEFWRAMDESRPDRPLFRDLYTP